MTKFYEKFGYQHMFYARFTQNILNILYKWYTENVEKFMRSGIITLLLYLRFKNY